MKSLISTILLLFLLLPAEAQVTRYLAKKGEKVDFDTAIVIKLAVYRKEFKRQQAKNKMLDSLHQVIISLKKQESVPVQPPPSLPVVEAQVDPPEARLKEKKTGLKWYLNPLLYLGAGLLLGVFVVD